MQWEHSESSAARLLIYNPIYRIADVQTLEYISAHKTAALIRASVRSGAILGNATEDKLSALTEYGEKIGIAFQIVDDILDEVQDKKRKTTGGNRDNGQLTYVSVFGVEKSKKLAHEKMEIALAALDRLNSNVEVPIVWHFSEANFNKMINAE